MKHLLYPMQHIHSIAIVVLFVPFLVLLLAVTATIALRLSSPLIMCCFSKSAKHKFDDTMEQGFKHSMIGFIVAACIAVPVLVRHGDPAIAPDFLSIAITLGIVIIVPGLLITFKFYGFQIIEVLSSPLIGMGIAIICSCVGLAAIIIVLTNPLGLSVHEAVMRWKALFIGNYPPAFLTCALGIIGLTWSVVSHAFGLRCSYWVKMKDRIISEAPSGGVVLETRMKRKLWSRFSFGFGILLLTASFWLEMWGFSSFLPQPVAFLLVLLIWGIFWIWLDCIWTAIEWKVSFLRKGADTCFFIWKGDGWESWKEFLWLPDASAVLVINYRDITTPIFKLTVPQEGKRPDWQGKTFIGNPPGVSDNEPHSKEHIVEDIYIPDNLTFYESIWKAYGFDPENPKVPVAGAPLAKRHEEAARFFESFTPGAVASGRTFVNDSQEAKNPQNNYANEHAARFLKITEKSCFYQQTRQEMKKIATDKEDE